MSEATLIEPDLGFKRWVLSTAGESLKKCAQCGTCSIVCPISPDHNPFPRKEIVWAQWGLKDRLLRDPDIWLCHQCNDCATHCPRGAHPGDLMAALRQRAIERYAAPGFLGRWLNEPKRLPLLLAIPAALLAAVIGGGGGFGKIRALPTVDFDAFFNHIHLDIFFVGFTALAAIGALAGLARFWKALSANPVFQGQGGGAGPAPSVAGAASDILTHWKFRQCKASPRQFLGHLLAFYGFGGLFATTALAFLLLLIGKKAPYPIWHPVKILGNLSGAAFMAGWALLLLNRRSSRKEAPGSSYGDWLFLWVIGATVITGFLAYGARVINSPAPAYSLYFVHLVLVFFLLVYLPYSKFAHLVYRAVAMFHARLAGREAAAAPSQEKAAA